MKGKDVGFLGCYFNEDGINPMHDEFFSPMGPEAPAILEVAKEEAPDVAISLHSHSSAPVFLRPTYVPLEIQAQVRDLAKAYYDNLEARGLPHGSAFGTQAESGVPPGPFNLVSALYHVSGAAAFTFECPHGLSDRKACHVTHDQILDMQLALYESVMRQLLPPL